MPIVMTAPRDELHSVTDWSASVWAGVIAGIVFVMLEMFMVRAFMGESPWAPPHMIAAIALGQGVLPASGSYAPFDMKIVAAAMMVHLPLSIAYGVVIGWLVHRFDWAGAVVIGALFGIAIYIINFYLIAPAAFPWFQMAQNWISAFAHAAFGVTAAAAYVWLRRIENRR